MRWAERCITEESDQGMIGKGTDWSVSGGGRLRGKGAEETSATSVLDSTRGQIPDRDEPGSSEEVHGGAPT